MRIPIIFIPKDIRVSRMMPHRIIYLQYKDFDHQTGKDIEQIIKHLRNFEPGIGFNKHQKPRLFGFGKQGQIVDLQEEIYNKYPQYKFEYDGSKQTVLCDIINAKEITADMRK
ncbi:hypothetical protein KJ855_04395 [Patescibacteria group bacterium]|nr:hypothetical protein [Patescibacteria group bacterium]